MIQWVERHATNSFETHSRDVIKRGLLHTGCISSASFEGDCVLRVSGNLFAIQAAFLAPVEPAFVAGLPTFPGPFLYAFAAGNGIPKL
jgi:hypothetical protein